MAEKQYFIGINKNIVKEDINRVRDKVDVLIVAMRILPYKQRVGGSNPSAPTKKRDLQVM